MKIQLGEVYMDRVTNAKTLYPNKTRKYLLPCLLDYGEVFTAKLSNVFKVAVGIGDIITDNCGFTHEKHIFVLLDSTIANRFFLRFMNWIRDQPMYEDDYVYGNVQKSTYHMVVLKLPEKFWDTIDKFKVGEYSKMYNYETISKFFEEHSEVRNVLIKDHNYKLVFVNRRLNRKFNTSIEPEDYHGELDFPPTEESDKFNHHLKKKKK